MLDVEKLIRVVHDHPNLWNKSNKEYYNRECTKITWNLVAEELSVPVKQCKMKWFNLRDTFRKECNRLFKNDKEDYETSKWRFFNDLFFLYDNLRLKDSEREIMRKNKIRKIDDKIFAKVENMDQTYQYQSHYKQEEVEEEEQEEEDIIINKDKLIRLEQSNVVDSDDDDDDNSELKNESTRKRKRQKLSLKISKSENEIDSPIEQSETLMLHRIDKTNESDLELDSDRMFLLSLLPYFKKFSDERNLLLRHKIQGIILEELSKNSNCERNQIFTELLPECSAQDI